MEAKDTVRLCPSLTSGWRVNCSPRCHEAQAEISFKAGYDEGIEAGDYYEGLTEGRHIGIKEVVEEITNTMDTAKVGYFAATVEKCLQEWQNKLKEWGL